MTDVDQAFQQCPDCGKYLVKLGPHRCGSEPAGTPKREQRILSAEADPRPDEESVLLMPTRKADGSYAYHETSDGLAPECGGGGSLDDDDWLVRSRAKARERGRSPCLTCLRLTTGVGDTTEVGRGPPERADVDSRRSADDAVREEETPTPEQ
jgi:hypothetical protein